MLNTPVSQNYWVNATWCFLEWTISILPSKWIFNENESLGDTWKIFDDLFLDEKGQLSSINSINSNKTKKLHERLQIVLCSLKSSLKITLQNIQLVDMDIRTFPIRNMIPNLISTFRNLIKTSMLKGSIWDFTYIDLIYPLFLVLRYG